ncbi:MAG: protein-disulfide reductase DsbD family protein [Candidatus Saccharicenans sp.]|nr:protein-disulfide reductase DsbD family protein [Candidatus Saccharicenans sp.]
MKNRKATRPIIFLVYLCFLAGLSTPRATMSAGPQSRSDNQQIVKIKAIPPEKPVGPGDQFELKLELTIAPGFHINSNQPGDEMLVPTSAELKKDPAYEVKEIIFPEAKKKKFKFSDKPISVYDGQVTIKIKMELAEDICGTSLEIEGKVRYQACDDEACLRPATIPFAATIKIAS